MKPRRYEPRNDDRKTAHMSAARPAIATHCGEPGAPGGGNPGETSRHDRGRGGVGANDEMARRAKDGEGDDRQDERVQAGDDRHLGDLCVAHDLGHRQRGERCPGDDVSNQPRPIERQDAAEQRQVPSRDCCGDSGRDHQMLRRSRERS